MPRIAVAMIVCGERYAEVAQLSVDSFLKFHNEHSLVIIADGTASKALDKFKSERVTIIDASWARPLAERKLNAGESSVISYDGAPHDKAWSGMKPVVMEEAVNRVVPSAEYILNMDADTLITGNIMGSLEKVVKRDKGRCDMFMVDRKDPRMLTTGSKCPGSGFVIWKRSGRYIPLFVKMFKPLMIGPKGGSQDLTNEISGIATSTFLKNPLFHFVSPDLKNPAFPDSEILKLRPAYIHLHGANGLERLRKFKKVFMDAGVWGEGA